MIEHHTQLIIFQKQKDLSKPQALDADPRSIQQINFTVNLDREGNTTLLFFIEQAKETVFEISQGTVKVL